MKLKDINQGPVTYTQGLQMQKDIAALTDNALDPLGPHAVTCRHG